jgi:hypothetical protein
MIIGVDAWNVYYLDWVNDTVTECVLHCARLTASAADMTVDMYNCINWDNTASATISIYASGVNNYTLTATFGSNCFDGGQGRIFEYGDTDITYYRTNFEDDPDFYWWWVPGYPGHDETSYHLDEDSPCIDAGLNTKVETDYDMDGEDRIQNDDVDVGADETEPPTK